MNAATLLLLGLVFGLVLFDVLTHRGFNHRALFMEIAVFLVGAFFIIAPQGATEIAHSVGIGRGVDFLLYPIVIWLTRESLLNRRRHVEDSAKITELTRALAIATARPSKAPFIAAEEIRSADAG